MTQAVSIAQSGSNNTTFRNRIINGAMMIDQRNAGAAVTGQQYLVDRWRTWFDPGTYSFQQVADAPAGFTNSLKITKTNTTQSNYGILLQHIEGLNIADLNWGTANAATVTLSFWVKSSVTGTFSASINNADSSTRSYIIPYTINSANTWELKTATISGSTSGTWLSSNGTGIQVKFNFGGSVGSAAANTWLTGDFGVATGATANLGTTNGATFYITGVQLEKGTTATPFEQRLYGTELALCQRYFETSYELGTAVGAATYNGSTFFQVSSTTTTLFNSQRPFAVTKRATPTMVYYNPATGTSGQIRDMSSNANYTVSSNFNSATTSTGAVVTSASVTANYQYGAHWTASSEL